MWRAGVAQETIVHAVFTLFYLGLSIQALYHVVAPLNDCDYAWPVYGVVVTETFYFSVIQRSALLGHPQW